MAILGLKLAAAITVMATAAASLSFSWTSETSKVLALGATLTQFQSSNPPLLVNVISVDHASNPTVQLEAQVANGSLSNNTGNIRLGRETVTALCIRTGALAAVNGDYWPGTGDPVGLGISNGEIYSEPYVAPNSIGRAAFGVLRNGKPIIGIPAMTAKLVLDNGLTVPITGIDRLTSATDPTDNVICAPIFGPKSGSRGGGTDITLIDDRNVPLSAGKSISVTVQGVTVDSPSQIPIPSNGFVVSLPAGSPIADQLSGTVHMGEHARVSISLTDVTPAPLDHPTSSWNDVTQAIGAGPILLQNGSVVVDSEEEGLQPDVTQGTRARTGVGVCPGGKVIIVTIDEGSALSGGITLANFAQLMQSLGATDAINLDGGGSTTMAASGQTIDYPSGSNFLRPVADMLTVVTKTPDNPILPVDPKLSDLPSTINVGDAVPLSLDQSGQTVAGNDPMLLWAGPVGSVGFVSQDGVFHATSPGSGTIRAKYMGLAISQTVTVNGQMPPVVAPTPTPTASPVGNQPTENDDYTIQPAIPPSMNRN